MVREYFEDCHVADKVITPGRTITETDIVMFATVSGDWNAVHTDVEFSKTTVFGERIAHGMLTLMVGTGLLFRISGSPLVPNSLIAVAGMDRVRFVSPVKIGDTIRLEGEITDKAQLPGDKGLLGLKYHIKNQHEESVVTGRMKLVAGCRPSVSPIAQEG